MSETSCLSISQKALNNNFFFIKSIIGEDREFVSVVKGNAYGHDISTFVPMAFECGIKSFAVFSSSEARCVFEAGTRPDRLIIMGAIQEEDFNWVVENRIEVFVFNMERLEKLISVANSMMTRAIVHLEFDTGLHRTGFNRGQIQPLAACIKKHEGYIDIEGVCTHLAGAENISNDHRIRKQIDQFYQLGELLSEAGIRYKYAHAACSAALINYPETMLDMVRVGIMQYGFWPSQEVKMAYMAKTENRVDPLKRVMSWKSKVMDVRTVKKGEYIGYGRSYYSESEMKIAIVPVGYSNGYSRSLSNQGKAIIRGTRVSVVGLVNMNMTTFDVTNIPEIEINDEVILIGRHENIEVSVASFSDMTDMLNYELLARLPLNIPRIKES